MTRSPHPSRVALLDVLTRSPAPLEAADVALALGRTPYAAGMLLLRAWRDGEVVRVGPKPYSYEEVFDDR